jgi:hypothetical protein
VKKERQASGKESLFVPSHYSLHSNFGKEKIKKEIAPRGWMDG